MSRREEICGRTVEVVTLPWTTTLLSPLITIRGSERRGLERDVLNAGLRRLRSVAVTMVVFALTAVVFGVRDLTEVLRGEEVDSVESSVLPLRVRPEVGRLKTRLVSTTPAAEDFLGSIRTRDISVERVLVATRFDLSPTSITFIRDE